METIQPFFKVFFALLLRRITQGVGLDLLHHGEQTIGTGGREVVFKADGINEMQVGLYDFGRRVVTYHPDKQGDDAFGDKRVAVGREHKTTVYEVALQPNATLAAFDKVAFYFILGIEWR